MIKFVPIFIIMSALMLTCSSHRSPREVTIDFVGSVIEDDSVAIEELLDIDYMVEKRLKDMPMFDTTLTHQKLRDIIIGNLTKDGGTRAFWSEQRLVVNDEVIKDDTAYVEFTLMDQKQGGIQYLTIYLYRQSDGNWRVFKYL